MPYYSFYEYFGYDITRSSAFSDMLADGASVFFGCIVPLLIMMFVVFLLSKESWNQLTGKQMEKTPYIFAYCLHESDVYYEAEKLSKDLGMKIICVPSGFRCSIKADFRKSLGPIEFLNLIRFADYIISYSY